MAHLTANLFSNADYEKALLNILGANCGFIKAKTMKNGAHWVQYNFWVPQSRKWAICQRFVSVNDLLRAKLQRTIERSQKVKFQTNEINYAITSKGHCTSLTFCNCEVFEGEFSDKFALFVDGRKVCKHQIAYAKKYYNCQSINEFSKAVQRDLELQLNVG